ncbi:MAG TPA: glutamate ABC transporter substrate-binding protein [Candidatus Stackebrandtia faecavium]|nr:glutamate ABC transporter substrate-binding protein [Candidatus Stackebrandtia faecavium]
MRTFRKAVIAGLAVSTLALSACAGGATKAEEDKQEVRDKVGEYSMEQAEELPEGLISEIKERGKMIVGAKADQPLIGEKVGDEWQGHDIEIARLLAMRIFGPEGPEKNLQFIEATSENRETYVNSGKVDMVIASYSMYPDRVEKNSFAGPYFFTGQNAMVAADNEDIQSIDDLAGKKVCIAKGSGSIENLKKENPEAQIETLDDYAACATQVKNGTFDAVSTDESILYGFKSADDEAFRVLDSSENFTDEPYGIGMKKGSDKALDFFNEAIELAYENGDWEKAFELTYGAAGMDMPEKPEIGKITSD